MRSLKLLLVCTAAFISVHQCKAAKPRQQVLTLNAELACADGDPHGSYALLFMDGVLVDSADAGSGGFTLDLPADKEAMLEVHKPGCVTKRIVLDTYNVARSQAISCSIVLFPTPPGAQEQATPVSRLSFDAGTGMLKVDHDFQVIGNAADPGTTQEFIAVGR